MHIYDHVHIHLRTRAHNQSTNMGPPKSEFVFTHISGQINTRVHMHINIQGADFKTIPIHIHVHADTDMHYYLHCGGSGFQK